MKGRHITILLVIIAINLTVIALDRVVDRVIPESAVAYDEPYIRTLFPRCGLEIAEPIHYGSWCGRIEFLNYQDIILAVKKP